MVFSRNPLIRINRYGATTAQTGMTDFDEISTEVNSLNNCSKNEILFAADGRAFTKKALTFLVKNKNLLGPGDELAVLHVQDAISLQIERRLGSEEIAAHQTKQADLVLQPSRNFGTNMQLTTAASGLLARLLVKLLKPASESGCR